MPAPRRPKTQATNLGVPTDQAVRVRGAREHNLKDVGLDIPRNALVVFSGVSGSGKSSLAFGTLYAEAQRRYFESVAPYARRLIDQVGVPDVDSIEGLPPAVALQQQRGATSVRSSVGSVTTLSSLLRMLYSRAGVYPRGQAMLYAEDFSANTVQGACPTCHGLGRLFDVTEASMVPDDSLSIRERAIAAWPPAWHGQNLRDILVTLGYDVDRPWRDLPKKDRDWILFTEEQPTVPVYAGFTPQETRRALRQKMSPSYQGTFMGARKYVRHTYATTQSASMKKRVARFMVGSVCPECHGKRLKREALAVTVMDHDIADITHLPLADMARLLAPLAKGDKSVQGGLADARAIVAQRISQDLVARIQTLVALGLGYLSMDRSTPTLSPGELQRLRLATQIRSNLFGVVYVLDEPTAGLHPRDGEALMDALGQLKAAGNSLFVVEHDLAMMRRADWLVDVGPDAGEQGGQVLYSGPPDGLQQVAASHTARYLFATESSHRRERRAPNDWLALRGVCRNNLVDVDVDIPLGVMTAVTGLSGSGKSSLISQALVELLARELGTSGQPTDDEPAADPHLPTELTPTAGRITAGMAHVKRLIQVDQKPIGRTPRSNLATYTGLFDGIRKLFAETRGARAKGYTAGRFSFNMASGRCPHCEGEGMVSIELLFMPSVYAPCPACHGARYNPDTLKIKWSGKSIADVLGMTVAQAVEFFEGQSAIHHSLIVLQQIGLGYLRLGQSATELSGGEAQRVKLATELQRPPRGGTVYVLDEPTTGLHPADVDRLMAQLDGLVQAGNSVIVVEHEMRVVAQSDWVIDVGPGAGREGGRIVASGTPEAVSAIKASPTAAYLKKAL